MKRTVREWVLEIIVRPEGSVTDHLVAGFHAIPQSSSTCWDGSHDSKSLLYLYHCDLQIKFIAITPLTEKSIKLFFQIISFTNNQNLKFLYAYFHPQVSPFWRLHLDFVILFVWEGRSGESLEPYKKVTEFSHRMKVFLTTPSLVSFFCSYTVS